MLKVRIEDDSIRFGKHVSVSFQRTLRIPDDGNEYSLPPGLGKFPIKRVEDYADRVPDSWREQGGVFIPMYQREALWMYFSAPDWRPHAIKVGVGKVNAVTGDPWKNKLDGTTQDYVVAPDQPWLDGINAGEGFIRQFVAMPLGMGYTVEGQVTGKEEFGGMQIMVYSPKRGRFPHRPPPRDYKAIDCMCCACESEPSMGLGAGGRMKQEIHPDEYGVDTWSLKNTGGVFVHIVNSMMYREITGEEPPATPISARMYTEYGFPWFDLYDEGKGDLAPSEALQGVKSVKEMDKEKGFQSQQDDGSIDVPDEKVIILKAGGQVVQNGEW